MISAAPVASASGAGNYYAGDDYYTADGQFGPAQWGGKGAALAGLKGEVSSERLTAVFQGKLTKDVDLGISKNGVPLKNRRRGIDLVFSPPKSVQIAIGVLEDKQMLADHEAAVKKTMNYIEERYAAKQENKNNRRSVARHTGNLLYAMVSHKLTRANDPGPHTHVAIANGTYDHDLKAWRALNTDPIYEVKSSADAFYLSELHKSLKARGIKTDRHNQWGNYEIAAISQEAIHLFSKQGNKIKELAKEKGVNTAEARRLYAVLSRPDKQSFTQAEREKMPAKWRVEAKQAGIYLPLSLENETAKRSKIEKAVTALETKYSNWVGSLSVKLPKNDPYILSGDKKGDSLVNNAVSLSIRHLSENKATFGTHEVVNETIKATKSAVPGSAVLKRLEILKESGVILDAARDGHLGNFTTKHALNTERSILKIISKGNDSIAPILNAQTAQTRINASVLLEGQSAVAKAFLTSTSKISAIQGLAGVGKSSMMREINSIIKETKSEHGLEMFGAAHALTAVQELNDKSGIPTVSLEYFNAKYGNMTKRAAYKERDWSKVIFVLDEASQVGNDAMLKFLQINERLGVKYLRPIGDKGQFQSVSAGSPFATFIKTKTLETSELTQILRQRSNNHLLKMVRLAANGQAVKAFRTMKEHTTEIPIDNIPAHIGKKYSKLFLEGRNSHKVIAPTNEMVDKLNTAIYTASIKEGFVTGEAQSVQALIPVQISAAQAIKASSFELGQVIRLNMAPKRNRNNFTKSSVLIILGKDEAKNTLYIENEFKKRRTMVLKDYDKSVLGKKAGSVSLYTQKTIDIRKGTKIRWTRSEKRSSQFVGQEAEILSINKAKQTARVRLSSGIEQSFSLSDPAFRHMKLGYAITAFKSQGQDDRTGDIIQTSTMSKSLNAISSYVMASRMKESIDYTVDNIKGVEHRLISNPVSVDSALLALSHRDKQIMERQALVQQLGKEREAKKSGHQRGQNIEGYKKAETDDVNTVTSIKEIEIWPEGPSR